jgi:hypothetical protein
LWISTRGMLDELETEKQRNQAPPRPHLRLVQ